MGLLIYLDKEEETTVTHKLKSRIKKKKLQQDEQSTGINYVGSSHHIQVSVRFEVKRQNFQYVFRSYSD